MQSGAHAPLCENLVDIVAAETLRRATRSATRSSTLAIDGKGCAGKSRLAAEIRMRIAREGVSCAVVSIDDFCNPRSLRYAGDVPEGLQVYERNFDEEALERLVLAPFRSHGCLDVDRAVLDAKTDLYSGRMSVVLPPGSILIAEGLHMLKRRRWAFFDAALFLHISDRLQLERALSRDSAERGKSVDEIVYKYKSRFQPSYSFFLAHDCPCRIADWVVDYEHPDRPIILKGKAAEEVACA
jgi:uridine kinase